MNPIVLDPRFPHPSVGNKNKLRKAIPNVVYQERYYLAHICYFNSYYLNFMVKADFIISKGKLAIFLTNDIKIR